MLLWWCLDPHRNEAGSPSLQRVLGAQWQSCCPCCKNYWKALCHFWHSGFPGFLIFNLSEMPGERHNMAATCSELGVNYETVTVGKTEWFDIIRRAEETVLRQLLKSTGMQHSPWNIWCSLSFILFLWNNLMPSLDNKMNATNGKVQLFFTQVISLLGNYWTNKVMCLKPGGLTCKAVCLRRYITNSEIINAWQGMEVGEGQFSKKKKKGTSWHFIRIVIHRIG